MKNKFYLFLTVALVAFLFTSCDESKMQENSTSSQNIVAVTDNKEPPIKKLPTVVKVPPKEYNLSFTSLDKEITTLEIKNSLYDFSNIIQPIVLVNFFSTWCPPCRGQIPHLNNLQNRYKKRLFMMGILLHDDVEAKEVKNCISLKKVDYYISNSKESNEKFAAILAPKLGLKSDFDLPMMVMFVYGEYYTHYEGTVPEEMIESDIKQALKEL